MSPDVSDILNSVVLLRVFFREISYNYYWTLETDRRGRPPISRLPQLAIGDTSSRVRVLTRQNVQIPQTFDTWIVVRLHLVLTLCVPVMLAMHCTSTHERVYHVNKFRSIPS